MERLPLLVLEPGEAAVLPGERRRLLLGEERMRTAIRLAARSGGRLAVLAFDPAQLREGEDPAPEEDRLLRVATACSVLRREGDDFAVLRGERRIVFGAGTSGACCDHDHPFVDGTEIHCEPLAPQAGDDGESAAAWDELQVLLRGFDLLPALRAVQGEEPLDRLAHWMALPPWVQGEMLSAADRSARIRLLADAARELAAPGSSFRADDLDRPYRDAEEYLDDRIREYEARARARLVSWQPGEARHEALVRGGQLLRRRRAALLQARACRARMDRRLAASAAAGRMPLLEELQGEQALGADGLDALLVAGLGGHPRFGDRLQQAARLLPPPELELGAWIAALERGAFPAA